METLSTPRTLNYDKVKEYITNWIDVYATQAGAKGFVMGVSGGIDSAVVSTLCAMTGKKLLVLEMPIHQGKDQVTRAKDHIAWLKKNFKNVDSLEIDLTKTYDDLYNTIANGAIPFDDKDVNKEIFDFSMANTRSRLRMVTLYQYAGMHKLLVAGTGNKVEDFGIGFYTKYGDGGVDLSPIADLMKSEVYELGRHLGVNSAILSAAPTDGLHTDGRTDEDQIGASYDELEWAMKVCSEHRFANILSGVVSDETLNTILNGATFTEREKEVLKIYRKFNLQNRHKMDGIPVCEISHLR